MHLPALYRHNVSPQLGRKWAVELGRQCKVARCFILYPLHTVWGKRGGSAVSWGWGKRTAINPADGDGINNRRTHHAKYFLLARVRRSRAHTRRTYYISGFLICAASRRAHSVTTSPKKKSYLYPSSPKKNHAGFFFLVGCVQLGSQLSVAARLGGYCSHVHAAAYV